jgi:hypothetical protein
MDREFFDANFPALLDAIRELSSAAPPVKITFRGRQGYSKDIGKYAKPNGTLAPKRFWLGHNQARAIWLANVYNETFRRFVAPAGGVWTDEHTRLLALLIDTEDHRTRKVAAKVKGSIFQLSGRPPVADLPVIPDVPAAASFVAPRAAGSSANAPAAQPSTLYAAIAAYVAHLKTRRMSDRHRERAAQVVEVNLKAVRDDCALSSVDYLWIDSLANHYKARPKNLRDGAPLTPGGVKNILTYLRLFFTWLDDVEYGGWTAPRKLAKCFKLRVTDLMTHAELRRAGTIEQFDVATLVKLFRHGTPHQRTLMLMALFTGSTQQELAVMEQGDFDLDAARLVHVRHKTKVRGEFWLPPELVDLLRGAFAGRRGDRLAFRTRDGSALVTCRDGKLMSDAVKQSWDDLRDKAAVPEALSFKYLRKFSADWMVRNDGDEMGQVMLSHARHSVLAKNYSKSRAYERFHSLQKRMHVELTQAGIFEDMAATPKHKSPRKAR